MARLLIGGSLRNVAERWPVVHHCIWAIEAGLFAVFLCVCWCLPLPAAQSMASAIMSRVGPRQPKHRHVMRNLRIAFPDRTEQQREQLGARLWGNVGMVFAEYAHLHRIMAAVERRVEIVGNEYLAGIAGDERGAVFVTAHLGNWEVFGCAVNHFGLQLAAVYTPLQNPYLDWIVERCRGAHGSGLLARDASMRAMIRELDAGRCVGVIMDQRVDTGEIVPMFGVDKLTTLVPARLALRQGAALVPVRVERLPGGRFRVTVSEPVLPDDPAARPRDQALQVTRKINARFEQWIRERPEDWFCTNRLWPKDADPARGPGKLAEGSSGPA